MRIGITTLTTIITVLLTIPIFPQITENQIEKDHNKKVVCENDSTKYCVKYYTPFQDTNRESYDAIKSRIIGKYGDFRSSHLAGHKHAGVDLKGDFSELVYPIGTGQVCEIYRWFPHSTIIIKHYTENGDSLYSQYVHVEDIQIEEGDWVNHETPIARLFTEEELTQSDFGTLNHLHFEIRRTITDQSRASWSSMTLEELNKYCFDPVTFLKDNLKE